MNYWDSKALVDIYETYFAIADKEGELKGAEVEVRKGLRLNIVLDSQSLSTGHSYNNLGRILIRGGEYKKGEAYLRKALSLYRLNEHYTDQGTCYENFSKSSLFQGDTLAALGYLDSAATAYHGFPESPSLAFALDKQQLKDPIFSQAELMSTLHLSRPDAFPLESVIESVARVDSIIGFLRYGVRSELSKRQAIAELRALYDGLINFSYQQWQKTGDEKYQQLGISYLERGKAQILQERQRRTLNEEDGQNTESLQEVRDLRENIYALKGRLRKTKDVKTRREIGEKINRQELQMYKKQEEIYQSKTSVYEYDGQFIGLEGISKTLEADEIVLDYFLGDETGYVALATKEGVEIKRLPLLTDSLVGMVKRLGTCLAAPGEGRKWSNDRPWREGKEKERLNLSFRLYESLVASVLPNHSDYQRITIIPDGILAFLPFGALLTEEVPAERPASGDKLPYLLVSHTVNYEFSAGIWRDRLESAYTGGTKALVIAPVQEKGRSIEMAPSGKEISLAALGYVAQEVDAVEKHIRSDVWRGPEACELVEKAEFGSYGVVHFSGHGEVFPDNISQSFLVLDLPEKGVYCLLRLPDLEAKKLNVDLLVLSACRTGEGELAQEEGVISLSRAGAIAGARSVVSSLWVANQASKAELFDRFYEQLAAGDRRDEALRGAKLHFLGSGEGFEHPYYWAAFLNTGSSKVLEASFVQ
ncbi:CHAT domain-containing protein [Neolewinella agarilytica]|nr:CHAT domain-containing tetratricopeptide repeat protein [Neolewinella agarilytica]